MLRYNGYRGGLAQARYFRRETVSMLADLLEGDA
jgi:hypothetical protein